MVEGGNTQQMGETGKDGRGQSMENKFHHYFLHCWAQRAEVEVVEKYVMRERKSCDEFMPSRFPSAIYFIFIIIALDWKNITRYYVICDPKNGSLISRYLLHFLDLLIIANVYEYER